MKRETEAGREYYTKQVKDKLYNEQDAYFPAYADPHFRLKLYCDIHKRTQLISYPSDDLVCPKCEYEQEAEQQ